jgi:hypothetical protein
MGGRVGSSRQARHWTRVEPHADALSEDRVVPAGGHQLAVYPARIVRCTCGAAILATDPEALRGPVAELAGEVLSLHASWCEELEVDDFLSSTASSNGNGTVKHDN